MFDYFKEMDVFNNIRYTDSDHSYLINGKKAISGTTLIHQFENVFDAEEVANKVAQKKGVSAQELLNQWALTNVIASVKGSLLHEYCELFYQKRVQELFDEDITERIVKNLKRIETYKPTDVEFKDNVEKCLETIKLYVHKTLPLIHVFLNISNGKLIPIGSEIIIGDEEYLVCGTIDQLFYNATHNTLEIWDWKTNKEFKVKDTYNKKLKFPLEQYDDTHFYKYSIQLNLYKWILEKNTNLRVSKLWLLNFSETLADKDEQAVYYECLDLQDKIQPLLEFYKNKTEAKTKDLKGRKYDI